MYVAARTPYGFYSDMLKSVFLHTTESKRVKGHSIERSPLSIYLYIDLPRISHKYPPPPLAETRLRRPSPWGAHGARSVHGRRVVMSVVTS